MTGIYYDDDFALHENSKDHPESKERFIKVIGALRKIRNPELKFINNVKEAPDDIVRLAYCKEYIDELEALEPDEDGVHVPLDRHRFDAYRNEGYEASAYLAKGSMRAARKAVGAICKAIDDVHAGTVGNAFCVVRPPGHHADYGEGAYGFCIFPNVAIGALYAIKTGFKRVAVFDHDVHHGNGTEEFLKGVDGIVFASIYEKGMWPYQHEENENVHESYGNIIKLVVERNCPRDALMMRFEKEIMEPFRAFKPDLILVSAGFDTHKDERNAPFSKHNDPVGMQNLEDGDFAGFIRKFRKITSNVVCAMEGGYNVPSLVSGVVAEVEALLE